MDAFGQFPRFASETSGNYSQYRIDFHPQASQRSNQSRASAEELQRICNLKRKRVDEDMRGIHERYAASEERNKRLSAEIEGLKNTIVFLVGCLEGRNIWNGNQPSGALTSYTQSGPSNSTSQMKKPNDDRAEWNKELTRVLCEIMVAHPRLSRSRDYLRDRHNIIVNDFKARTGVPFTYKKLKNKEDALRSQYNKGDGFDPELLPMLQLMFGNRVGLRENSMAPSSSVASGPAEEQGNEIVQQISAADSTGEHCYTETRSLAATIPPIVEVQVRNSLTYGTPSCDVSGIEQVGVAQFNPNSIGFQRQEDAAVPALLSMESLPLAGTNPSAHTSMEIPNLFDYSIGVDGELTTWPASWSL